MSVDEKHHEWFKQLLSEAPERGGKSFTAFGHLRPMLELQELMLGLARQGLAGEASRRTLGEYQAEVLRGAQELWKPLLATERATRKLVLGTQAALLDMYGELLRSMEREPGGEGTPRF